MSAHFERSQVIDRPVATVFHFTVDEHVKNHPRWDPDIELWLPNDESIHVGTVIRRRNSRSGTPVEGTMEVVEYEPSAAFGVLIHDGPMQIRARTTFEALGDAQSRITMSVEIPGMDDSMDKSFLLSRMDRSLGTMKQLIESET